MKLIVRPRPNDRYFDLNPKQATFLAWQLAKDYGINGNADMLVFKDFTSEYSRRRKSKGQMALV